MFFHIFIYEKHYKKHYKIHYGEGIGMKEYYLERYDKIIFYDGTPEGLIDSIMNDEDICYDRLVRGIRKLDEGGWMACYREDTEGRRVKGGGGTEPTGKAKNSKAIMSRRENRWPGWLD